MKIAASLLFVLGLTALVGAQVAMRMETNGEEVANGVKTFKGVTIHVNGVEIRSDELVVTGESEVALRGNVRVTLPQGWAASPQ